MKVKSVVIAGACIVGSMAYAQSLQGPIKARQGLMQVMSINLSVLGDMAKGATPYDAAAAQAAADSLVGVGMIDLAVLFPEGSDNASIDGTRALPKIWDDLAGVGAIWADYQAGVSAMQAAAGTGQEALGPALGAIGKTCGACHDTYRAPRS